MPTPSPAGGPGSSPAITAAVISELLRRGPARSPSEVMAAVRPGASAAPDVVSAIGHFERGKSHLAAGRIGPASVDFMRASELEPNEGMKNVASPTAELVEKITKALPLRRWGTEDDIADAALYLSSDAGRYVTGAILEVDGGATIASPESGHADAVFAPQADPRVKGR
jgi:hypothetical protein